MNGLPKGAIIMWYGEINDIPDGWLLCNGEIGTPDLSRKFIVGADKDQAVKRNQDMSIENVQDIKDYTFLYENEIKKQKPVRGSEKVTLTVQQMPKHKHTGTTSEDGSHQHKFNKYDGWAEAGGSYWRDIVTKKASNTDSSTESSGNHKHTFTTAESGGEMPHENRPPYYALYFIMKVI